MAGKHGGRRPGAGRKRGVCSPDLAEFRLLCRENAPAAVKRLRQIIETGEDEHAISAARELLDRGFGRVPQLALIEQDISVRREYESLEEVEAEMERRGFPRMKLIKTEPRDGK